MPIASPQLDDLTYDRVVAELTRRIPVYCPEWTDFNDSDPGITLIQLFAYLSEMVGYRLNRIPEKNQIELLKLLGIELKPAHAAATKLALLLSDPTTLTAYTLSAGASAKASTGSPPPSFETDDDIGVVPAQAAVLATTLNEKITDPGNPGANANSKAADFLTLIWDGKSPQMKDLPLAPITLMPAESQRYLWVGVSCNTALDAGFLGVKVVLAIQFDDDEQPTLTVAEQCGPKTPAVEKGVQIDWLSYYDTKANDIVRVPGRIDDTTNRLANSGTHHFYRSTLDRPNTGRRVSPVVQPSRSINSSGGMRRARFQSWRADRKPDHHGQSPGCHFLGRLVYHGAEKCRQPNDDASATHSQSARREILHDTSLVPNRASCFAARRSEAADDHFQRRAGDQRDDSSQRIARCGRRNAGAIISAGQHERAAGHSAAGHSGKS